MLVVYVAIKRYLNKMTKMDSVPHPMENCQLSPICLYWLYGLVAPCKRLPESSKFLLLESGIRNPEDWNMESTMVWNPESTMVWNRNHYGKWESGIQKVGIPGPSWILLHRARLDSHETRGKQHKI